MTCILEVEGDFLGALPFCVEAPHPSLLTGNYERPALGAMYMVDEAGFGRLDGKPCAELVQNSVPDSWPQDVGKAH